MINTVPDTVAVEPTFVAFLSEPTIWLWDMGWFQHRKKFLEEWFRGKKILVRKYLGKKIPTLKKIYLSWLIILEKKSYTVVCRGKRNYITTGLEKKNHYPNQITHTLSHPPKRSNGRLLALTKIRPWPPVQISLKNWMNSIPPTIPFGIVACSFYNNLSQNSCIIYIIKTYLVG